MKSTKHDSLRLAGALLICFAAFLAFSCSNSGDEDDVNTPGFEPAGMVKIECGGQTYFMGSEDGLADESPIHNVNFTSNIWMDTTEVTQRAYDELMDASYPSFSPPDWNTPYGVGAAFPAYAVTWSDAALFCNAKSRRDGLDSVFSYSGINGVPGNGCELIDVSADLARSGYRLPTEAEWEFAARGGDSHDFFWGEDDDPYPASSADTTEFNAHCVWTGNSYDAGSESAAFGTQPVGSKAANGYGLYDMSGNVYEWCHDWYGEYAGSAQTDPTGPATGSWNVLRGGSWGSHALYQRVTNRTFSAPDYLYYFIGFRTVMRAE